MLATMFKKKREFGIWVETDMVAFHIVTDEQCEDVAYELQSYINNICFAQFGKYAEEF